MIMKISCVEMISKRGDIIGARHRNREMARVRNFARTDVMFDAPSTFKGIFYFKNDDIMINENIN